MGSKFNFLALMENALCGKKLTMRIDRNTRSPLQKMMRATCFGEVFLWQGQESWSELT